MGYDAGDIKARVSILQSVQDAGCQLTKKGRTWWGCCPFHAEKTPSFQVDPDKGLYHCFSCGAGGDVIAFAKAAYRLDFAAALAFLGEKYGVRPQERPPAASSPRRRSARPSFDGPGSNEGQLQQVATQKSAQPGGQLTQVNAKNALAREADPDQTKIERARRWYEQAVPLAETPAETYLRQRGIPPMFPTLCRVKYAAKWYGKGPAVLFPIVTPADDQGDACHIVAVQGRYIDPAIDPQKQTAGPSSQGAFLTPECMRQPFAVICEAPIDALTLAQCGVPALAVMGTNYPSWLPDRLQGKPVYAAFDNDKAGEGGARKLCDAMRTPIYRLRPDGVKDWNDMLMALGVEGLSKKLAGILDANGRR